MDFHHQKKKKKEKKGLLITQLYFLYTTMYFNEQIRHDFPKCLKYYFILDAHFFLNDLNLKIPLNLR